MIVSISTIKLKIECFKYFPKMLNGISSYHMFFFSFPMIGSFYTYSMDPRNIQEVDTIINIFQIFSFLSMVKCALVQLINNCLNFKSYILKVPTKMRIFLSRHYIYKLSCKKLQPFEKIQTVHTSYIFAI